MRAIRQHRHILPALAAALLAALIVGISPVVARADASAGIAILHSNDVHCAGLATSESAIGYAGIAQAVHDAESTYGEGNVTLVDAGDAIQGQPIGTISKGADLVDLMDSAAYDVAVPGNHEFDYGVAQLQALAKSADYPYVSCNVVNTQTNTPLFDAYTLKAYTVAGEEVTVAYVGITTPTTLTSESPSIFQNSAGETVWSFYGEDDGQALYSQVQETVDAAEAAGADYVIAIAHLGKGASSTVPECYTSTAVVANTTGIDGVIDGHTHEIYNVTLPNKDGEQVPVAQCGTQFQAYGQMTITPDGDPGPEDVKSEVVVAKDLAEPVAQDAAVAEAVQAKQDALQEELGKAVGTSTVGLSVYSADAEGNPWWWVARMRETNLGDYVADSYRAFLDADVAIINGGGIRAPDTWVSELSNGTFGKPAGSMTYGDFMSINSFANSLQLVEVTGQDLLDALEYSVRMLTPAMDDQTESTGSFLQVSGITFTANIATASPVVENADGGFESVNPLMTRRVSDVKVNGEPIEPDKAYTLATIPLLLSASGNYTMFADCEYLRENAGIDYDALVSYLQDDLNGTIGSAYANPDGDGRINLVAGEATVYRLYNRWSGEHLFTTDRTEIQTLTGLGWTNEGARFTEYADTDAEDSEGVFGSDATRVPVYRIWNVYNGDHLFTTSTDEIAALMALDPAGWQSEGVAFWAPTESDVPVTRLYNPYLTTNGGAGSHLWTTLEGEVEDLTNLGWKDEGTGWYAVAELV